MAYNYDRRTAGVEPDASSAKKRNDEVQKASVVISKVESLGAMFDGRARTKLEAAGKKLLKLGDVTERAAKKALGSKGEDLDAILSLIDSGIRKWNAAKMDYLTTNKSNHVLLANEARNLVGAVVELNSWIMDLADILKNGPNRRSVRDSEMQRMR